MKIRQHFTYSWYSPCKGQQEWKFIVWMTSRFLGRYYHHKLLKVLEDPKEVLC